jgi:hypothetical protein
MKIVLVIMSYLSNAEEIMAYHPAGAKENIEFAKYLLLEYPNTEVEITAQEMNEQYAKFKQ